jgi:hypothetical protein
MSCLKCLLPLEPTDARFGLHVDCFMTWFKVASNASFVSLVRRSSLSSEQATNLSTQNTSFFHGKFKKYSAELEGTSYILKMRESDAPELPEVEYLCNQIGKSLNIPVAEFYIIDFEGDNVFVTKNFIKPSSPTDLQHIYHFRSDEQHNCEELIRVIAEKTKRPSHVEVFINTLLFDSLIGNHDRHGRNLALVVTAGSISLAPIYDNVSYLSLEKGAMLNADFNPSGKISTQTTNEPGMKDYVLELLRLGYEDSVRQFYHKTKLPKLDQLIDKSFCSELMKNAIKKLILKRYKELEDGLNTQTR